MISEKVTTSSSLPLSSSSGSSSGAASPSGRERSMDRESLSNNSSDPEMSEYLNMRCSSLRTEMIAERERKRRKSSGYPGLAFGSSGIFSSNTQMKFNIISNELHNIQNVQLKRVRTLWENNYSFSMVGFMYLCIFYDNFLGSSNLLFDSIYMARNLLIIWFLEKRNLTLVFNFIPEYWLQVV